MLVNERNDGSDVLLLNDIQRFRAVDEYTVQHVQHTLTKQCNTLLYEPYTRTPRSLCYILAFLGGIRATDLWVTLGSRVCA